MENKINNLQVYLWIGFTALLAVTLAVNAVQAIAGSARLASHHYFTLAISVMFTWEIMSDRQRSRALALARLTRIKAAKHSRTIGAYALRAVRGLSALFTLTSNKIRTGP